MGGHVVFQGELSRQDFVSPMKVVREACPSRRRVFRPMAVASFVSLVSRLASISWRGVNNQRSRYQTLTASLRAIATTAIFLVDLRRQSFHPQACSGLAFWISAFCADCTSRVRRSRRPNDTNSPRPRIVSPLVSTLGLSPR